MAAIAERLLNVGSKIIENEFADTEITDQEEVIDLRGGDYDDDDQANCDDDDAADEDQDSNEKDTVNGDNQRTNATDNNDSTENPTEPNVEGSDASSAAKETEKEQTSDNNNNSAVANNANTTAPPPSQPQTQKPQGQQHPEDDAAALHRAFKGCDVGMVARILAQRDSRHRNQIAHHYKKNYDEELTDRIFSLLFSGIKTAIALLLLNESERDATIVCLSLQRTSFNKAAVTEVICSRTPPKLRSLKQAYFTKYGSRLLEDISASTSQLNGYHKELLVACLDDKARDEGTNVDVYLAEEDAKQLYKDGEKRWGTNEKTFIDIFTKRNRPHLAAVDCAYEKLYGHSLEEAVRRETSGAFEDGLLTLLKCAKNPAKYFAEVLYNSMKGLGTSDTTFLRVVVTRAGVDMEDIKKEYFRAYKTSLKDCIHSETSGESRTFLLNLVE